MRTSRRCMAIIAAYSLLFSQTLAAQQNASGAMKIADGTTVRLSLLDSLSSATNQVDDPVNFELTGDVKVGDVVAIPRGATARGHVVEVEPKKLLGRAGKLNFAVDYVKAPDGSKLRLRANSARRGEDKSGTDIVDTVVVLSGLFLLMHGKDVNIPKGTTFNAYTDGDSEIALGGRTAAPQPTSQPVAPPPTGAAPTIVIVDPSGVNSGETVDVTTSTLAIRGVVTDPSGIPAVTINGTPVSMLPKSPQAAAFSSDPIKLHEGDNELEIVATNAARAQAKITFVARYYPSVVLLEPTVPPSNGRGLAKADILSLLKGKVPSARVTELVEARGINFVPTDNDFKEIRAAGGHDDLVNGLMKAKLRR